MCREKKEREREREKEGEREVEERGKGVEGYFEGKATKLNDQSRSTVKNRTKFELYF